MKHILSCNWIVCLNLAALVMLPDAHAAKTRQISLEGFRDKMKGGWVGQMAGVTWGAPTEFKFKDQIIPEDKLPEWKNTMINNAFNQDDLYVEMTFLRTLEQYGLNAPIRQAGIDFANSEYKLWCANLAGRNNLRKGIAPPDSSHPKFNKCPNDIDYQIEADYSGLIAPGLPQFAIDMGEKFGRLMNYGDGMYAGQFIGALYAEAFFESDRVKLVETALRAIPADCQYAEMVRDLLAMYRAEPKDWQKTWQLIQRKYRENPEYQKASNGGIDCKINGAYVLLGYLYGEGDIDRTIIISMRGGQDSDCNPSSAAGVLGTQIGYSKLPARFTSELSQTNIFSHTAYSFPGLMAACEKLAREIVVKSGGKIKKQRGKECFVLPARAPQPSKLELSWAPGPITGSRFTPEEMAKIRIGNSPGHMHVAVEQFAPGWEIKNCGTKVAPGLRDEWGGRKNVLVTHPLDETTGCMLMRKNLKVAEGKKTTLRIVVAAEPKGDFDLIVRGGDQDLLRTTVSQATATDGPWVVKEVDLSKLAGKKPVRLDVINEPSGWTSEAAYWAEIAIFSQ
jgi:hypothetical protein